jgi:G:T/U-mismatch repair DNA glycosylase
MLKELRAGNVNMISSVPHHKLPQMSAPKLDTRCSAREMLHKRHSALPEAVSLSKKEQEDSIFLKVSYILSQKEKL